MKKDILVILLLVVVILGINFVFTLIHNNQISDLQDQVESMNEQIVYLESEIE